MKNILICLEKMDIGGVETSVLNQVMEYKKRGYNPIIIAKKGLYTSKLREKDIIFEEFEFDLENNINMIKAKKIIDIIEKYKIDIVLINQFPCILSVLPACLIKNIPYVIFFHTVSGYRKEDNSNVLNWFETTYPIFKDLFGIAFRAAHKIISISEGGKNYLSKRYNLPKDKIIVLYNSVDLTYYNVNERAKSKKNWLLISRLAPEKIKSIKNGIDLFDTYDDIDKTLKIVGDGPEKENIIEYIETKKSKNKIELVGARNDIREIASKSDVVLGLGRVILEALAMKRIAVIMSNEDPKQIVTISNIKEEAEEGFCGLNLESTSCEELAREIKEEDIDVEENYNFVKENLNIEKNIYLDEPIKTDYTEANLKVFELIQKLQKDKIELEKEIVNLKNIDNNEFEKLKQDLNTKAQELKNVQEEKEKIFQELQSVYNSKRFKIVNNIAKILKK